MSRGRSKRKRPDGKAGRELHKALVELGYVMRAGRHCVYRHPGNGATLTVGTHPTDQEKTYMVLMARRCAP